MKKSKILKLFIMFICMFSILFIGNNVYGYQLKFKVFYNSNSSTKNQTSGYVILRTFANTYGEHGTIGAWTYAGDKNSFDKIANGSNYPASFQSYALALHNEYLSTYNNSNGEITMGYNYTNYPVQLSDKDIASGTLKGVGNKVGYVSQINNFDKINKKVVDLDGNIFKVYRNTYLWAIKDVQSVTITDWLIKEQWLKEALNNNSSLFKTNSDGSRYTYFSLYTLTGGPNSSKSDAWTADGRNFKGKYWDMKTSYQALQVTYDTWLWSANRGLSNGREKNVSNPNLAEIGQSIVNHYDNELYLPAEFSNPQEIYIRHVACDEKGNVIKDSNGNPKLLNISNDKEIQISGSTAKAIANTSSKIKDRSKYQEFYSIPITDTLQASRSLIYVQNKQSFEYKGFKYSTATKLSDAEANLARSSKSGSTATVRIDNSKSNAKTYTVIEFKYYVPDIPKDDPKSGIKTLNSKDEPSDCQMTYTPTNADITPYLIANKFKLNNLKYAISDDGKGNVAYKMDVLHVDKLVSGSIANNDGELGNIFGGEDARHTLLMGEEDKEYKEDFPVNIDKINSAINKFAIEYDLELPAQNVIDNLIKGNDNKTKKDDFEKPFSIPGNRYNGLRKPKLIANYERYDVKNSKYLNEKESDETSNTAYVLVYNPLKIEPPTVKSEGVIDHSTEDSTNTSVIQKNANFELTLKDMSNTIDLYNNERKYSDYLSRYYLIFDFDIVRNENTEYDELYNTEGDKLQSIKNKINVGDTIPRGTLIELNSNAKSFKAKAGASTNTGDNISQDVSKITLIGVSNNMPDNVLLKDVLTSQRLNTLGIITEDQLKYISGKTNEQYKISSFSQPVSVVSDYCELEKEDKYKERKVHDSKYYNNMTMYGDAYYFVKAENTVTNIGRIYDFKVTDCSDVDYKEVFRKSNTGTINDLTKIQYFSGIKELKIYSSDVNELGNRENISIANNSVASKTILPLGPYKNTNTSYVNAPKMGYRISFDLKTSGYYQYTEKNHSERRIQIKPSYYYISKDGTKYNESIDLYYKDSNGKYVKFEGSNYTIYFKPNDGYRNILNSNITNNTHTMSDKLEPLQIGSKDGFVLNYKMMNTSDNFFIQSWYGEFKLPNSTIAVNKNGSITNPLTNGYVGVRFDITCIEKDSNNPSNDKKLSYNQDNKNANPKTNTTQWDYEGYLGFSNPGQAAKDLSIQLEKGTWNIKDQEEYKKIKSTVVFFDLDNRAANDFD